MKNFVLGFVLALVMGFIAIKNAKAVTPWHVLISSQANIVSDLNTIESNNGEVRFVTIINASTIPILYRQ